MICHCAGSHLDYRALFGSKCFLLPWAYGKAIPKRYQYWNDIVTEAPCPQKACLKSLYVLWCPQQAVRTWPTLHKNQQDEPAIMNRDNCNIFPAFLLPYLMYMSETLLCDIANYEQRYLCQCPLMRPRTYWVLPAAHIVLLFGWIYATKSAWRAHLKKMQQWC